MAEVPRIETARMVLRQMCMDDWRDYRDLMMSDRAQYMGGPFDLSQAWGLFCSDAGHWGLMGHGALMMTARETGDVLGQVGINHGPLFPEHELGWFVYPAAEGKGFAFEAAQAMRDWAFGPLGLETLVSYVDPANLRSRALAERLGARLDTKAARQDPDDLVYRHPRQ